MGTVTLNDIYNRKSNSFDDLRFILAAIVIFYHSYELVLYPQHDPITKLMNGKSSLGSIAVYSFFVLSGFFMIQSLENSRTLLIYFRNRLYRLLPAFWFSLIFFSIVLLPLLTNLSLKDYSGILDFIWKAGTFHIFDYAWIIPGTFPNNTYIDNINGSMWTLKHELGAYILLPLFYFLAYRKRKIMLVFTLLVFVFVICSKYYSFLLFRFPVGTAWVLSENEFPHLILFFYYFLVGSCIYLYRDKILLADRQTDRQTSNYRWVLFLSTLFVMSLYAGNSAFLILLVWVPYVSIWIGSNIKIKIFSKYGDYSYGMYIYAFPIQQLVLYHYGDISAKMLFVYSFLCTLIISIFSYHFIEKPILSLKNK